ncbi:MAG: hypothetical protein ACOZDY_10235 [Pseudomonadota bacterium]
MVRELKRQTANVYTSLAYLALVAVGFQIDTRAGWLIGLALIALIALFAWLGSLKRFRAIDDTPTSRVASAAQGYVELEGRAYPHPGAPVISKLNLLPCCWYRYEIWERGQDNKWQRMDHGESADTFLLRDGSGECVVDPEDAEVLTRHRRTWHQGSYRYTEWTLIERDPLYALGEFATLSAHAELNAREDIAALLAQWKRDRQRLLKRFDADADDAIGLDEWDEARRQAKAEVERQHREYRLEGNIAHVLRRPADGRLFLLANVEPERLARRYRNWAWVHLAALLAAATGVAYAALYGPPLP